MMGVFDGFIDNLVGSPPGSAVGEILNHSYQPVFSDDSFIHAVVEASNTDRAWGEGEFRQEADPPTYPEPTSVFEFMPWARDLFDNNPE